MAFRILAISTRCPLVVAMQGVQLCRHEEALERQRQGRAERIGEAEVLGHLGDQAEPGTGDDAVAVVGYFNPRKCSGSLHLQGALLARGTGASTTTVSLGRRAFLRIQTPQGLGLLKDRG